MKPLFGLVALVLSAVLVLQWRDWPALSLPVHMGEEEIQEQAPAPAGPSPLELLEAPTEKQEYAAVTERPLFMPDRRPPAEEPEPEPEKPEEQAAPDLARMILTGVMITAGESYAWVRDGKKSEPITLRLGDDLQGWTVKAITADEIRLERQGETNRLELWDFENKPPPLARNPRTPRDAAQAKAKARAEQRNAIRQSANQRLPDATSRRSRRPAPARRPTVPQRAEVRQPRTRTNAQPRP